MSPIGRVFIVLNLILAGTFVGFAGTYLQQQDNFRDKFEAKSEELTQLQGEWTAERVRLSDQNAEAERQKTALNQQLQNARNEIADLTNEKDRLSKQLNSMEGDLKTLSSVASATKTQLDAAFQQAKDAYDMAIASQQTKDQAVRERDDAVGKLRDANAQIAQLESNVESLNINVNELNRDKSELALLVDVAKAKGFLEAMAVPQLKGTVAHVAGKLLTVSVTENPAGAEIKPGFPFAIYEGSTYKGDAIVQEADSEKNVAFCRITVQKPGTTIKVGDSAATQTN